MNDNEKKRYWEWRKKFETQFQVQLESLRKDLNNHYNEILEFEDICYRYFEMHFPEYYNVHEGGK